MNGTDHTSGVYSLATLLAFRPGVADCTGEPLMKLVKVPAEAWRRYDPKVISCRSQQRSSSKEPRGGTAKPTEVTEALPMDGDALRCWVRQALWEKKRELEESTGVDVSERRGLKGRQYLVVSGSRLAVGKAVLVLEALLQEAQNAITKDVPGSIAVGSGEAAGQTILSMVKTHDLPSVTLLSDPEPISKDEFLLRAIEMRESAEIGADKLISETFGETGGWSFAESLTANEALQQCRSGRPSDDGAVKAHPKEWNASLSAQHQAPGLMVSRLADRPPPPPVPTRANPPSSTLSPQNQKSLVPKVWKSAQPLSPTECILSPVAAMQNSTTQWACSACTLLNPDARMACGACEGPRPAKSPTPPDRASAPASAKKAPGPPPAKSSTPPDLARAAASVKNAPATKVCKLSKRIELADPLPQRKAAPHPAPRILRAGLVVDSSCTNTASGRRWAERPVERLTIGLGSITREAEEDDPDLACYLWDRKSNRPKAGRYQRVGIKCVRSS